MIAITLPWRRPLHFVAKVELFDKRWQGWLLSRLGAFPIRRGESDTEAMTTARMILERGGAVCIFPEGTRIRAGSLAEPKRGMGRLALETGAAVLPIAVLGTEHVRRGWRVRPRKVKLRRPIDDVPAHRSASPALAETVTARIWPNIELQWEGSGPTSAAQGGDHRIGELGDRDGDPARPRRARGSARHPHQGGRRAHRDDGGQRALPAGSRAAGGNRHQAGRRHRAGGSDLIVLAVPSAGVPAAIGATADRIGGRSAVLILTKGLVPPIGTLPTAYVAERVRARAIASLGGPAHAREAVSGMAALVLGSADADLRSQLGAVFDRAGLLGERTEDVVGVEMAGVAKNAAALAAAAAEPHGLNAAGIAATEVWRECVDFGLAGGANLDTFTGLAGVGDLTATVMAPGSRNRRAGELLGSGVPAAQIPEQIGQASEALDSVPLCAETVTAAGIDAPALEGLAALIEAHRRRCVGVEVAAGRGLAAGGVIMSRGRQEVYAWRVVDAGSASKAELDRAFEDLYRAHLRDVYSYSYYRVGNHHDAEDSPSRPFSRPTDTSNARAASRTDGRCARG